jgi:hypothetical protein
VDDILIADAITLILPDGTGITEVLNCPYCSGYHTHGRIYGDADRRFPGCCDKDYIINIIEEHRMDKVNA